MRITARALRQIIREEVRRALKSDESLTLDEAFGMDPLGRMAQRAASSLSKKGGGLDIKHGKGPGLGDQSSAARPEMPSISRYSREEPSYRSAPSKRDIFKATDLDPEEIDTRREEWLSGKWAGKYANLIVSPYDSDKTYTLPDFIESGAWKEDANFDQFPDDDDALRDRLTWVGVTKGPDISEKDANEIVRLWNERESREYAQGYSAFEP